MDDGGLQLGMDERGPDPTNLLATIVRVSVPSGTRAVDTGYTILRGNHVGGEYGNYNHAIQDSTAVAAQLL